MKFKENSLTEIARELASEVKKKEGNFLPVFKEFRKTMDHRLRIQHNNDAGGKEVARRRSDLIDILVRQIFEIICEQQKVSLEGLAIAAFGGYGRREMNPFSDVDVMFIHQQKLALPEQEEVIRQTLVTLWDLGFKVGHSVRSITQAIQQANADLVIKTSMLECRFLIGDRQAFQEFRIQFEKQCVHDREAEYLAWRISMQRELRHKFGASVFMQEPNVKSATGGLRDYHNLIWSAYFKEGVSSTAKLVEKRILRDSERRFLEKGYDFLLRVRTELHYLNGRPQDQLTLQLQGQVATSFHYPQKDILRRCEAFMRDYYQNARNIHLITQTALARMQITAPSPARGPLLSTPNRRNTVRFDGLVVRDGLIYPESRDIFHENPSRILSAFQHAQLRQLEFSEELKDLIRRRLSLIDRTFQYARKNREVFLSVLSHKGEVGHILRLMHDLGVLGKFIPEFGALTCLVQHEFYHRYTADEHTLVCIEKLDHVLFSDREKLTGYRALFQKIEDPSILYLAILLHDTGKAANKRHHEEVSAELSHRVAKRFQLSSERRRMLITLVNTHYALSHTAQTRNLDDPATIQEFAKIIRTPAILDALMLLTLADGMGTSDQSWSDWKETLVWQLYQSTMRYLEAGPQAFETKQKGREVLLQNVAEKMARDYADEIEGHFAFMPERYFRIFEPAQIVSHIRLFRKFFHHLHTEEGTAVVSPVFKWLARPEHGHSEVWVCGWDRPRLLERIAGAFLSAQMNILSADVFTRSDNLVLDIFRVCGTDFQPISEQRDIQRVKSRLQESLLYEDFDFRPLIKKGVRLRPYRISQEAELPVGITVNNSSHPFYTLVDIQTPDRLGLLYDLLRALGEEGIFIAFSRITTERDVAMDSFYVVSRHGQKITDPAQIKRIQQVLHQAATHPTIN